MALLGDSIRPELMVNDYSGFARAGETQGQMYAQMGKDVGGMIDKGVDTYKQVKQFKGQQEAFGKSMDYMAKAFPDRAEMFNNAKSAAFDPNANLIQQAAAINSYGSNIDMIAKMEAQQQTQAQIALMNAQAKATGRKDAIGTIDGQTVQGYTEDGIFNPYTISGDDPTNPPLPDFSSTDTPFRATAFGRRGYDPQTAIDYASGAMDRVGGDENVGSGGIPYAGITADFPTVATKAYPAGTILKITSNLYPEGKEHIVAGTGPADPKVLDFYGASKKEYDILAGQELISVEAINGNAPAKSNIDEPSVLPSLEGPSPTNAEISRIGNEGTQNGNAIAAAAAMEPRKSRYVGVADKLTAAEREYERLKIENIKARTEATKRQVPRGTKVKVYPDGTVEYTEGEGVNDKDEKAEAERKKQQGGFVDEFTKTAAETIRTDFLIFLIIQIGAKFGADIGRRFYRELEQGRVVSRLNTLKANLALDKINQMRAASPTGGAAGNMTEKEWPLFMQEFGALDAAENKKDLEARLKNASVKLFNRVNGTPEERQSALEEGVLPSNRTKLCKNNTRKCFLVLVFLCLKFPPAHLVVNRTISTKSSSLNNSNERIN
jgi:hypothetical protein